MTDVDAGEILTATLTLSVPAAGTLAASGANFDPTTGVLSITGTVVEVNAALASLTFTPVADDHSDFTVAVSINDGFEDGTTAVTGTITVTGIAVNDIPVANDDSVTTTEDTTVIIDVLENDSDIDNDPLLVFVDAPSHGTAALNENGTPNDPTDDYIVYTPEANYNGTDTFTYLVIDGQGGSATATVTITITAVNDAPIFTLGTNPVVVEDSGAQTINNFVSPLAAGPADESGQNVQFVTDNDNHNLFSVQPTIDANGNLIFTPEANAFGTATVTVYAQDNGGTANGGVDTSTSQTFTITITAVNDVPSFVVGANQTSAEDASLQTVPFFIEVSSAGPGNEVVTQTLDYIVSNDNNSLFSVQPSIAPNGTLTYTAAPNQHGTATVTVQIHDNGGGTDTSATQTFTITITAVNDAPVADSATFTLAENSAANTVVGTVTGSDIDVGSTLTFSISGGNTNGAFSINPSTGVITVANSSALNYETNPTFNLIVTVTDNLGATGTANVTVNLTNIDEPLELSLPSQPITFYARHGQTVIDAAASFADPDGPAIDLAGATLTVQITASANKNDRLGIYGQTAGPGQISLDGKNINYGDVRIGRITKSGTGAGTFVITFNASATPEAVSALMKVIAYKSTVAKFPEDPRTVTFTVASSNSTVLGSDTQVVNVSRTAPSRQVQLSGVPITYQNSAPAILIAPTAVVTGPSYLDFDGGQLEVRINDSNSNNQLGIVAIGGITRDGNNFLYNGQVFGQGAVGKNSILIKLSSSNATPEAVQALARSITFSTSEATTNFDDRVISFKLTDVTGVRTPSTMQTIVIAQP